MEKILVFKTAADATMKRLFHDLRGRDIDCLIQSSQIVRYSKDYPDVTFIDIRQEGFYDLPDEVIRMISDKCYDQLYVTFSGIKGHNYGNVMELVCKAHYKRAFFYNCNGDKTEIPVQNGMKDKLCRAYIAVISAVYGLRRE